ncbi:unnamed protein product, partial [Meganyctiphanes norvegica]
MSERFNLPRDAQGRPCSASGRSRCSKYPGIYRLNSLSESPHYTSLHHGTSTYMPCRLLTWRRRNHKVPTAVVIHWWRRSLEFLRQSADHPGNMEDQQHYREQITSGKESFAELASKVSDCSSAKRGGDLGLFARGAMQKPFEDASFALKVGELSEIVSTDSGVHIILRTA